MMKKSLATIALSITAAISYSPLFAAEAMVELANEKGCFICHAIKPAEKGVIPLAPSYTDIANRYKDAADKMRPVLVDRVLHGTTDKPQHWEGSVNMRFMPPNVNTNESEATQLVEWILAQKASTTHPAIVEHDDNLAMASNAGCMTCHRVTAVTDQRYLPLAPAFRDIAKHYGEPDKAKMVDAILHGTLNRATHWENVNMRFMPGNLALRKADAETLVDWILSMDK